MRTKEELLAWDASYIHHPTFHSPEAAAYLDYKLVPGIGTLEKPAKPPPGLPPFLHVLYQYPVLTPNGEQALFLKYNYAKLLVSRLQQALSERPYRKGLATEADRLINLALDARNTLVTHNLRMVVHICKGIHVPGMSMEEVVSCGNMILLKCVDKFDVSRLNRYTKEPLKFSTYACNALKMSLWRDLVPKKKQLPIVDLDVADMDITGEEEDLDGRLDSSDRLKKLMALLRKMDDREQHILRRRYGMDSSQATLEEIGKELAITKERVRQLQRWATRQLSEEMGGNYEQNSQRRKTHAETGQPRPLPAHPDTNPAGVPQDSRRRRRAQTLVAAGE